MNTTNTFAEPFEVNVYDAGEGQVWVPSNNTSIVKQFLTTDYVLIGRVKAVVVEPHIECIEVDNPNILPPIGITGCLYDGVTIVTIVGHIEDVKLFP